MEAHAGVCQPKSFSHLGFQLEHASRSGLSSETLIETRRNQLSPLLVQIEPSKLVYLLNLKKKRQPGPCPPRCGHLSRQLAAMEPHLYGTQFTISRGTGPFKIYVPRSSKV